MRGIRYGIHPPSHSGTVHPRGCGEYMSAPARPGAMDGSSPRMRGIPIASNNGTICLSVHPRGCGEYVKYSGSFASRIGSSPRMRGIRPPAQQASRGDGSSPRMRGIRAAFVVARAASRFIPADAGNTSPRMGVPCPAPVHPRGCGEYVARRAAHPETHRFIPADAGNTETAEYPVQFNAVHPRGCGEYCPGQARTIPACGSSPRMRGIRLPSIGLSLASRFIPADAGNTKTSSAQPRRETGSSPRMRGIHVCTPLVLVSRCGSSPRMRGIRGSQCFGTNNPRFIPADAGNTGC